MLSRRIIFAASAYVFDSSFMEIVFVYIGLWLSSKGLLCLILFIVKSFVLCVLSLLMLFFLNKCSGNSFACENVVAYRSRFRIVVYGFFCRMFFCVDFFVNV